LSDETAISQKRLNTLLKNLYSASVV